MMVASMGERVARQLPIRVFPGAIVALAALVLAAFFAFVGYHKAFSPVTSLAEHRVWALVLPGYLGRMVGWSEMILAAALLTVLWPSRRGLAPMAALLLILNQGFAALVHFARGEINSLPQNATLVMLLAFVAWAASQQRKRRGENS